MSFRDDCKGERGKRGKRGHRGHRGKTGATGATGPTGPVATTGGLLKFLGQISPNTDGSSQTKYLGDDDFAFSAPVGYPVPTTRSLEGFATNVQLVVPIGATVTIQLLQNGVPVPGFSITYIGSGVIGGVATTAAGPAPFAVGDTIDVSVTTLGFTSSEFSTVAAMIGTL